MKSNFVIMVAICALFAPALLGDWTTTTSGQVTTTDMVGVGTHTPGQGAGLTATQEAPIHVVSSQNKNTILLVQNQTNDLNVAPVIRTQADVASQSFLSHASSRTISRFGTTLGGWNELLGVTGNGMILGTFNTTPLILGTNGTQRVHITAAGSVGIGTSSPTNELHVLSVAAASIPRGIAIEQITSDFGGANMVLRKSRGAPGSPAGVLAGDTLGLIGGSGYDGTEYLTRGRVRFTVDGPVTPGTVPTSFAVWTGTTTEVERLRINSVGDVSIGLTTPPVAKLDVGGNVHATGNISADGTIFAKYQDVAEWVPSVGDVPPATVVVIAANQVNVVMPSTEAYDTRIAGVVSAQPGLVLGEAGGSKVKVATTGRVKVKVDATRAPIYAGDILVTSAKTGMAMKSQPMELNGRKFHQPGTLLGKALEPLGSGTGEILVLLSLQ